MKKQRPKKSQLEKLAAQFERLKRRIKSLEDESRQRFEASENATFRRTGAVVGGG